MYTVMNDYLSNQSNHYQTCKALENKGFQGIVSEFDSLIPCSKERSIFSFGEFRAFYFNKML